MKTKLLLLTLLISALSFAQYTLIPDANFENALSAYDDIPNDGQVPTNMISAINSLNVTNKGIYDLTGIQDFTSLVKLFCSSNNLSSLDISSNTLLNELGCSSNQLTSLNIIANTALEILSCGSNQLSNLNISNNTLLTRLYCSDNLLTSLNVNANTLLTHFNCNENLLTTIDISTNIALNYFVCYENQLSILDTSTNIALISIHCNENQITALDLSTNIALEYLNCSYNQLPVLDLVNNTSLIQLSCIFNELTSLDVSMNTNLTSFNCIYNQLTYLNVKNTNNINFTIFFSHHNPDLTCIIVDNATWSDVNWSTYKDATSTFVNSQIACNALSVEEELLTNLEIYPNPANNNLNIKIDVMSNYSIYSFNGQLLNSGKLQQGKNTLDVSELNQGIYFIKIHSNSFKTVQKLIIK